MSFMVKLFVLFLRPLHESMAREKLVYFCLFFLKIWLIAGLLSKFLGEIDRNQTIFIRHISRAKVSFYLLEV